MALTVGTRLGHYAVTSLLGEGGMGQVWQATDTQLNRQVALKILPDAFASDPDRLARFTREAQILASLNHPNIAAIHGIEEAEGTRALVLELVEGPTLADRISQGPIPLDEALPIAKQIAEALEAAHEAGVIHRDLKPANIKVREDGTVKVLDFGLAKALDPAPEGDPSQSPTLTAAATQMGVIMGTAAYMSPEQARGKPVDKRADIWSFGVLFVEMLTGRRLFESEDVSMTLSSVLQREPDWSLLPSTVPPLLGSFLRQCLAKDPKERVHDIADVRLAMEGVFETTVTESERVVSQRLHAWQRPLPAAAAGFGLLLLGGLAVWVGIRPAPPSADLLRFSVIPAEFGTNVAGKDLAISADGTHLAYGSGSAEGLQVHVRRLDELEGAPLRGADGAATPFFSPDGQWVGVTTSATTLQKVSILGGPPVMLTETPNTIQGASWGADDQIVFGSSTGLYRVSGGGGEAEALTTTAAGITHVWPAIIPERGAVVFSISETFTGTNRPEGQLAVLDLSTGDVTELGLAGMSPHYVPTGHLLYTTDDRSIRAVAFDAASLEVTGNPVPLVEDVAVNALGAASFGISDNGRLVYGTGTGALGNARSLVWVDRQGREERIPLPVANYFWVRVSPNGTRLAWHDGGDVWTTDLSRPGTVIRVTTDPSVDSYPVWTPDGTRVVFQSDRADMPGLFTKAADGTGEAEQLLTLEGAAYVYGYQFTPDGEALIAATRMTDTGDDFGALSMDGDRSWQPVLATEAREGNPAISPDGQWVAYRSHETGQSEAYVARYPSMQGRQPVSVGGGWSPVWSPDGSELFYQNGSQMMAVPVSTAPTLTLGTPELLFEGPYLASLGRTYDVSPDGRFLMIRTSREDGDDDAPPQINVVLNWHLELLERVPVP